MLASEIMTKQAVTVFLQTPIMEVADLLRTRELSAIPVLNELGLVMGTISQAELFSSDGRVHLPSYVNLLKNTEVVMGGKESLPFAAEKILRTTAEEVMNKQVYFAQSDTSLEKLASKMLEKDLSLIPVTDSANRFLGVITKGDIINAFYGGAGRTHSRRQERNVDQELDFVSKDFTSKFVYVARARANIWITTATVLFILGFLAGVIYVVNPQIFVKRESQNNLQNDFND